MINVSATAKKLINSRRAEDESRQWYLIIEWRKGEMNNTRASDGSAIWSREPDKGLEATLVGYGPEVDPNLGEPLLPGIRVILAPGAEHDFPGGTITVKDGQLKVVPDAV